MPLGFAVILGAIMHGLRAFAAWHIAQQLLWPLARFAVLIVAVGVVIAWIPAVVPSITTAIAALPPSVVWGLRVVEFDFALTVILGAFLLRFFLRWVRGALTGGG